MNIRNLKRVCLQGCGGHFFPPLGVMDGTPREGVLIVRAKGLSRRCTHQVVVGIGARSIENPPPLRIRAGASPPVDQCGRRVGGPLRGMPGFDPACVAGLFCFALPSCF